MIKTPWGYTLTELNELPTILTEEEFNSMTAGRYTGDVRIPSMLAAAQSSIREFCAWHVADNQPCELTLLGRDRAVSKNGSDVLIQLPATFVTGVTSVEINDGSLTDYDVTTDGLLWLYDTCFNRRAKIVINYTAGLTDELAGGLKELVANRVTHALASSYGIQSEAAGGESVTYSSVYQSSANATSLPETAKEFLNPYHVRRLF